VCVGGGGRSKQMHTMLRFMQHTAKADARSTQICGMHNKHTEMADTHRHTQTQTHLTHTSQTQTDRNGTHLTQTQTHTHKHTHLTHTHLDV